MKEYIKEMAAEGPSTNNEKCSSSEQIYDFLERIKFLESVSTEKGLQEWKKNLEFEDFKKHLIRLNGIFTNTPINEREFHSTSINISGFFGNFYSAPDKEDREILLKEVFEAFQEIPNRKDDALLLYLSLQAIHPFADGNGRTGRLLFKLLEKTEKINKKELEVLLDHKTADQKESGLGREVFEKEVTDTTMDFMVINNFLSEDILGIDFRNIFGAVDAHLSVNASGFENHKISQKTKIKLEKILGEGEMYVCGFRARDMLILKHLQNQEMLEKYRKNPGTIVSGEDTLFVSDRGKEKYELDGMRYASDLSEEDAKQLFDIHRQMKIDFVKKLLT